MAGMAATTSKVDFTIDATLRAGPIRAMMCPGHDRRRRPRRALALLLLCARATEALRPAAPLQAYLGSIATSFDKVRVDEVGDGELGLVLEKGVRAGDVLLEVPFEKCISAESVLASPGLAAAEAAAEEAFEPWCGDASLLALGALTAADGAWVDSFPKTLPLPLLEAGELPVCSGRAFEALRENAADDFEWLAGFGAFGDDEVSLDDWLLAVGWVVSRAVEVGDDGLCLVPGADLVDHDDLLDPFDEMAACGAKKQFGRGKSVVLKAAADGRAGDKVVGSYGPLPASEYLERYGFLPARGAARRFAATADLRFELDAEDRFVDDKLTVLYDNGAIDGDDAESGFFECCVGGEPDLEVLRFLRLSALAGGDAFLLEPIFANELWDFLAAPISPDNERAALEAVRAEADALQRTLLDAGPAAGDARFEALRRTELDALDATLNWVAADLSMLAGKEYYQEKRLKSLGLDTEWSEDEGNQWTGARGTAW